MKFLPADKETDCLNTSVRTVGELIHAQHSDLTHAERKIARILFSTNMLAGMDSAKTLATRANVSPPSVIRFASKLGFAGYSEFQDQVRDELEHRITSPLTLYDRTSTDTKTDTIEHARDVFIASISASMDQLPRQELSCVIDLMADVSRPLWLTGGRFSGLVAELLYLHLYQLRPKVRSMASFSQPREDLALDMGKRDVVIFFDFRRYQTDSINLAQMASGKGAKIVLITDPWLSPIADLADYVIPVRVDTPSPYDSVVPAAAIAETLISELVPRLSSGSFDRIGALEDLRKGQVMDEKDGSRK